MKALKLKQLCYRCVSCIFMPKYAEFENKGKKKHVLCKPLLGNIARAEMRFTEDKIHKYSLFVHRTFQHSTSKRFKN